jgi:hypothetical protein
VPGTPPLSRYCDSAYPAPPENRKHRPSRQTPVAASYAPASTSGPPRYALGVLEDNVRLWSAAEQARP